MEGLGLNCVYIPVETQDMEIPGFGSSTSHTVHRRTTSVRKYLYQQVYKICVYVIQELMLIPNYIAYNASHQKKFSEQFIALYT